MATAFPLTTYPLSDRTQFNAEHIVARDVLDDGEMRIRVLGASTFVIIRCVFSPMSKATSDVFEAYLITNRSTEFTMVLSDASPTVATHQGYIWSDPTVSVSNGLYTWSFDFRAKVV